MLNGSSRKVRLSEPLHQRPVRPVLLGKSVAKDQHAASKNLHNVRISHIDFPVHDTAWETVSCHWFLRLQDTPVAI